MSDPGLRERCEELARLLEGTFSIEHVPPCGFGERILSEAPYYVAAVKVFSKDPDARLLRERGGRGRTPDDAMRDLLFHHTPK